MRLSLVVLIFSYCSLGLAQNMLYKSPDYFLNRIIVNTSHFDFKKEAKFEFKPFLTYESMTRFASNSFDSLTPQNPNITYHLFRNKMLDSCQKKGLDSLSLSICLDVIKKNGDSAKPNKYVILPVASYNIKYGKKDVWVVACIWEDEETLSYLYFMKYHQTFDHNRHYIIDPKSREIIGFRTCE